MMAHEPTPGSAAALPHPALKAILLCDRIIQEAVTEKVSLIGIVDRVVGAEFPFDYVRGVALYARVTDAAGEYALRMEVVRLEDEWLAGGVDVVAAIPDRMAAYEIVFDLARIRFERAGRYEFRLIANGRFIGGAVLLVESVA
jgi:hypothetical protein